MKLLTCKPHGMHTFIDLYIYFTGVKKGKKTKPSEYENIISVDIAWGPQPLLTMHALGDV